MSRAPIARITVDGVELVTFEEGQCRWAALFNDTFSEGRAQYTEGYVIASWHKDPTFRAFWWHCWNEIDGVVADTTINTDNWVDLEYDARIHGRRDDRPIAAVIAEDHQWDEDALGDPRFGTFPRPVHLLPETRINLKENA